MGRTRLAAVLAGALLSLPARGALADVPPPDDYVEPCTVPRQQGQGEQCQVCGDAYHAEPEACAQRFVGTAFQRRCRTSGASTWDEVWCRSVATQPPYQQGSPRQPLLPPRPPPATRGSGCSGGSCAVDRRGGAGRLLGWAVPGAWLALTARRRRRRSGA